tara:strand:- start:1561 stop:3954 length:2394 start_codon:yes stop_codon:yes gene_type:complete
VKIRLPHEITREANRQHAPFYQIDVVCIVDGSHIKDTETAYRIAKLNAECAHVPARPVIVSPSSEPIMDPGARLVCVRPGTKPSKMAVAAMQGASRMVTFVDQIHEAGWLIERLADLGWRGPLDRVPDVGWQKSIIAPKLQKYEDHVSLAGMPLVAVVITVKDSPEVAFPCIEAVMGRTRYPNRKIIIVDDGSDVYTEMALRVIAQHPLIELVRLDRNVGYLTAANIGMECAVAAGAWATVLLNSDVLVTDGWLSSMVRCSLRTDAALVNPHCNDSALISLPMSGQKSLYSYPLTGGRGYRDISRTFRFLTPKYPRAIVSVGQCLLIRTEEWCEYGPFDEDLYGRGYGEECELWAQVLKGGGTARIADDAYVFHESHATHGSSAHAGEKQGMDTFLSRHGELYARESAAIKTWVIKTGTHRGCVAASKPCSLPISFVTSDIGPWGGMACIMRLAHELSELGFNASVAHLSEEENQFKPSFGPMRFRNKLELVKWSPRMKWSQGIVVATHWHSVTLTDEIKRLNPDIQVMAFWQDREDWFEAPDGLRHLPEDSTRRYVAIKNRVVNARWVGESAVRDFDVKGYKHIPVGVDAQMFRPSFEDRNDGVTRVLAMWRPRTPRRGHRRLEALYRRLRAEFGDRVALELYGEDDETPDVVDVHHGWLSQRDVAALVRGVDIFVEPSDYQGFGLPGLEAMASMVALVSMDTMGVHEYGVHDKNCLISDTDEELYEFVCDLIRKPTRRVALAREGRNAALELDWPIIAARWARHVCGMKLPLWAERYAASLDEISRKAEAILSGP